MNIKNISTAEQKVMPHTGGPFACAPGATVDVADVCALELVRDLPSVWEVADVKPSKKSKKEI